MTGEAKPGWKTGLSSPAESLKDAEDRSNFPGRDGLCSEDIEIDEGRLPSGVFDRGELEG